MAADIATDIEAARLLVAKAADLIARGEDAALASAHAKKFATPQINHRLLGISAHYREERNYYHCTKPLRDNALCGLQIHFGLRQIFSNHRRMLFQRQLDGRLAWLNAFRRQTQSPTAPC